MLDFKKISRENQEKAINNTLQQSGAKFLAFLIEEDDMNLFGWFNWDTSNEGHDYWTNLIDYTNS